MGYRWRLRDGALLLFLVLSALEVSQLFTDYITFYRLGPRYVIEFYSLGSNSKIINRYQLHRD